VDFTEPPLDLIGNELKQELKEVPLWQQHYDKPQRQVLQEENLRANGFAGAQLTASALKMITYEELNGEACIKASWFGREMSNTLYIYMHGIPSSHHQQCPVGRNSVHAPGLPSNIPPVEPTGATLFPRQPCPVATVASTTLHGQNLWMPPAVAPGLSATSTWGANPPLEPDQSLPKTPEEALLVDASGTPASGQEASQRQSTVFETRTKNPLVDEGMSPVIVCLPCHTLTSYEHVFAHLPLLHTCHSTPRPHNIILQAPCDLSIPWAMELTIRGQDTCCGVTEYQSRGQEADLWGFLVNLEWGGFETAWGPPTDTDTTEHAARVAAVEDLKRQLTLVKPRFGHTTKCCVINMGKGSKYNGCCIHGERPLFQGSSLVHNITLCALDHTLLTIRLTSKKEEVSRRLVAMRHCLIGWLNSSWTLPASVPSPSLRQQVWEYFPHDLTRYFLQAKQLALENRGIRWTPVPPVSE
jgi:hypothetical protein